MDLVRWVSGLNQQFAKLSYGFSVPGVRIPLSPQKRPGADAGSLILYLPCSEFIKVWVSIYGCTLDYVHKKNDRGS